MPTAKLSEILDQLHRNAFVPERQALTDGQLLDLFRAGRDEDAFALLMRRHASLVWAVCWRGLGKLQDAEDAFQATFLVLARKAGTVRRPEHVGSWLHGVACRAVAEARAAARRCRERQATALPEPQARESAMMEPDVRPLLHQAIDRLADKYRSAVVLCDLEGRPREEVARALGIPEGTLSSRLATARKLLAQRLARRGLALSAGALMATLAGECAAAGVPAPPLQSTMQAVTASLSGVALPTAAGRALDLTERILRARFFASLRWYGAWTVAAAVLLSAGAALAFHGHGTAPPAPNVGRVAAPTRAPGPDLAKTGGIEPAVIAAWEGRGATFGWLSWQDRCFLHFTADRPAGVASLPSFAFAAWPAEGIKGLPAPTGAFGVSLGSCKLGGRELKDLSAFAGLEALNLGMAQLPPGGMDGLAGLKGLKHLGLNVGLLSEANMKELGTLRRLETLNLQGDHMPAAGLAELAALTGLREVNLSFTGATDKPAQQLDMDAALRDLAPLVRLRKLFLTGTLTSNQGLKHLARFQELETLYLNHTRVTDEGLGELAAWKNLEILDLEYTKITDAGLKDLPAFEKLRELTLSGMKMTGASLKPVARLRELRTLRLNGTAVTDAQLRDLAGLQQLRTLELNYSWQGVTADGLKALAGLKELRTLDLYMTTVMDEGMKTLAGLTNLEELTLGNGVTDAGLKEVVRLQHLRMLAFHGNGSIQVTDASIPYLARLPKLQHLELGGTQVTGRGLKELAVLDNLRTLDLNRTQVNDAGLQGVAALRQLEALSLANTKVTGACLKELSTLPRLASLDLSFTEVPDAALLELRGFPALRLLHIVVIDKNSKGRLGPTEVTQAGVAALRKAAPKLQIGP
jgi:RNA polymerase sigma factor (sigma-70 family)